MSNNIDRAIYNAEKLSELSHGGKDSLIQEVAMLRALLIMLPFSQANDKTFQMFANRWEKDIEEIKNKQ